MKRIILSILLLFTAGTLLADSLLNNPINPQNPYNKRARERKRYDYQVHDTVLINISVRDTFEFTRKLESEREATIGARLKSFITYFGKGEENLPDVEAESQSDYSAEGTQSRSSNIRINVPAEIVEILPNGDLVLDASRTIWISDDSATVRMGGRVHPKFIKNDVVDSEKILQLFVKTESEGPLSENERRGFLKRFFDRFKPL